MICIDVNLIFIQRIEVGSVFNIVCISRNENIALRLFFACLRYFFHDIVDLDQFFEIRTTPTLLHSKAKRNASDKYR